MMKALAPHSVSGITLRPSQSHVLSDEVREEGLLIRSESKQASLLAVTEVLRGIRELPKNTECGPASWLIFILPSRKGDELA